MNVICNFNEMRQSTEPGPAGKQVKGSKMIYISK